MSPLSSIENILFKGIVSQYFNIRDSKYEAIEKVEDFRIIYDHLFLDGVQEEEIPDGKLFRKKTVYVQGENKRVHQGASNEEVIIKDLESLISFMNSSSYSFLLKSVVTHYFFEYVHLFYDSNGRLGRFILSSYLARKLDKFTGLSFSNSVRENRKKYLDSFTEVSDPKNKGDITHFVQTIYELVISGQERIIEDLLKYQARFSRAAEYLEDLDDLTEEEKNIVFCYIQNHLFDSVSYIEDRELSEMQEVSRPTLKKRMKPLLDQNIIVQRKQRPSIHVLSEDFISNIEKD